MPAKPLTPQTLGEIEAAASAGCSEDEIAALVGVRRATLDKPKLAALIARARAKAAAIVGAALLGKAREGNVMAASFWLKARNGWRDTDAALLRDEQAKARRTPRVLILEDDDEPPPPAPKV